MRAITSLRMRSAVHLILLALLALPLVSGCLREEGPLTGPALAPGTQLCLGVPPQMCEEQVASLRQTGHGVPIAYRITCTRRPACTLQEGDATVEALYADGSTNNGGFGWAQAVPAP